MGYPKIFKNLSFYKTGWTYFRIRLFFHFMAFFKKANHMLSNTGIILSMDNKKVQTDTFNNDIVNANAA